MNEEDKLKKGLGALMQLGFAIFYFVIFYMVLTIIVLLIFAFPILLFFLASWIFYLGYSGQFFE